MTPVRRLFLQRGSALALSASLPTAFSTSALAQASATERRFAPQSSPWRTFDVTTRVSLQRPGSGGASRVWLPVPSIDNDWQRTIDHQYASNGEARLMADGQDGARLLAVQFDPSVATPTVELTSRVQTRNRSVDWQHPGAPTERLGRDEQAYWTRPTAMIPTDGIVRRTALKATQGAHSDQAKVRALYDWIVVNTHREPKVRGCGEGDIKTMLETGDLGGKCADLNALFVGLCRAVGVPARDLYGLRLVPSAFGYRELSGNPASLKGAQHCRAEVWLQAHGWVAMDPADVAKVMRQETTEWIKTVDHPVVKPVYQGLYGNWEGNWLAWNSAHDVALPGAQKGRLPFFMYPVAETVEGRIDSYAPDDFRYQIAANEIKA